MPRCLTSLVVLAACATLPSADSGTSRRRLTLGGDSHLHLTMSHSARPIFRGEPGDGSLASTPMHRTVNQVDTATLSDSGVRVIFAALWPPPATRAGRHPFDEMLDQVDDLHAFSLRQPEFAFVTTSEHARRVLAGGRLAMFAQLEGGEGIRSIEDVDRLYLAGVRCVTLVHLVSSPLGGAAALQLSRSFFGSSNVATEPEGLSALGRQVVTRMFELGIVVDLAHASDHMFADVLEMAEAAKVPVIVSHASARVLMPGERSLSDENARRVVALGGFIGVTLNAQQLQTTPESRAPGHEPGTCDDLLAHWVHFAKVVPPEALVLGSDFNGFIVRPREGRACPVGIRNAGDLPDLWRALEAAGIPGRALDGMGERMLRVLEQVEHAKTAEPHKLRLDTNGYFDVP